MTMQTWEEPAELVPVTPSHDHTDSWTQVLEPVGELAQKIASTEFVPVSLRGSVPKTAAAILYGRELDLPPMTALGSIHVINGKAGISAELMRAMIARAGHEIRITDMSADRCQVKGKRRGEQEWTTATYTMVEAVKAGDAKKNPQYSTRPAEMLLARATTRLARMVFADVIHGMASVEELEDLDEEPVAVPVVRVEQQQEQEPVRATIGRRSGKVADAPPPPAPAPAGPAPVRKPIPVTRSRQRPAQPAPEPVEADAVEVEELDTLPADPEPQPPAADVAPKRTSKAMGAVMAHWKRLGVEERTERLVYTSAVVGRPIESTTELTEDELKALLSTLERSKNLDRLDALMQAHEDADPS